MCESWVWGAVADGDHAGLEEADEDLVVVCDPRNTQKDSSSRTPTATWSPAISSTPELLYGTS